MRYPIVNLSAIMLFMVGCLLIVDPATVDITRLFAYSQLGYTWAIGIVFVCVACAAWYGANRRVPRVGWLLPQQFLLLVSAAGAVRAMVQSAFGDGVQRPRAFIIADQLPVVLIAFFHLLITTGLFAARKSQR